MYVKEISYKDYNGTERKENFYFHLSEAELHELELGTTGGLSGLIKKVIETQDLPGLIKLFKELILISYGEKSADGKYFMKEDENGRLLSNKFKQTEAYSKLYMELATNDEAAAKFVNGIMPDNEAIQKALQSNPQLELVK